MIFLALAFTVLTMWLIGRAGGAVCVILAIAAGYTLLINNLILFFLFETVVLALVASLCIAYKVSPIRFVIAATVASVLCCVGFLANHIPAYREVVELRQMYPIQSLRERLAYEVELTFQEAVGGTSEASSADANVQESENPDESSKGPHWEDFSQLVIHASSNETSRYRERSLSSLHRMHKGFVSNFIQAQGFGVGRMPRILPRKQYIELPDRMPLPLPSYEPAPYREGSQDAAAGLAESQPRTGEFPAETELGTMHLKGVVDFANPATFGYVPYEHTDGVARRNLDRVVGFRAHGFANMPDPPTVGSDSNSWQIVRLQLISLLKHEVPVAYRSKNLPNMQELESAETRPLDAFETGAVDALNRGEDLSVSRSANEIRMVGSIRAAAECLACHEGPQGRLLGAFTYRLRRNPPLIPTKAKPPVQVSMRHQWSPR